MAQSIRHANDCLVPPALRPSAGRQYPSEGRLGHGNESKFGGVGVGSVDVKVDIKLTQEVIKPLLCRPFIVSPKSSLIS